MFAEIVETTLVVSWFHFLRVGRISELRVIILPGTAVGFVSRFSNLNDNIRQIKKADTCHLHTISMPLLTERA